MDSDVWIPSLCFALGLVIGAGLTLNYLWWAA